MAAGSEVAGPSGDRRVPRRSVLLGLLLVVAVLATFMAVRWRRAQVPVGSEVPATLCTGQGCGGWTDERGDTWCILPDQRFPVATGKWDDGVLHGGELVDGTLRFETDERATFRGDLDGEVHPVALERKHTNKIGCPSDWRFG